MSRYANKVVVVTGGTTGIGLEAVRQFVAEGAAVVATGSREESVAGAQKAVPAARFVRSDAQDVSAIRHLYAEIGSMEGGIDVLFLNAGIYGGAPLGQVSEAQYDGLMDVNTKGVFFGIQESLPYLRSGASILVTSSINAHRAGEASAVYGASKAAVNAFVRYLVQAEALREKGIRINTLSPGPIDTPIWDKTGMPDEMLTGVKGYLSGLSSLGRFGTEAEVARLALFLASDGASFITGADFVVDGGVLAKLGA